MDAGGRQFGCQDNETLTRNYRGDRCNGFLAAGCAAGQARFDEEILSRAWETGMPR